MLYSSQEMVFNSPCLTHKKELIHHEGVNTPRSDEDRLNLMELMVFLMKKGVCDEIRLNAARLSKLLLSGKCDVTRLQALVDKKKIVITEEVVREILQLNDAEGVICLPNEEIFAGLARMGYEKPSTKLIFYKAFFSTQWKFFIHTILHSLSAKRTSWNEFSSAMASALICLSSVRDVAEEAEAQVPAQGDNVQEPATEEVATDVVPPTPTSPLPSSLVIPSLPPHQPPCPPQPQDAEGSSLLFQQVLDTCSALALRVEGLENDKAAQQLEIVKLKARVKKLENINKVKSFKLRRLKKVGTSQRVESLDDVENVFNQERIIVDMDQDEGIELVADQEKDAEFKERHADKQAKIYNIDLNHSSKVLSMQEDDTEVAAASTPIPAAKPRILTITDAPTVSTRRRKGVVIRDPEEELPSDTLAETPKVKDKGKGILIEAPKPMKKKDQIELDAKYARKLQEEINKEHEEAYKNIDWNAALDHVQSKETQYIKRYHGMKKKPQTESEARKNMISYLKNTEAKRRKLSEEAQEADDLRKRLEILHDEDDDVFVEATRLAQKVPIVDYQIVVIDNKPKYKIMRVDDTHQFYISFTTLLKNFDREDLEALWKIVRDIFSTSKPTNFLDDYLLLTLKTMFEEPDGQDAIWRNQKSVHGLALVKR
nr:hypothetical protein [Tanacetum cinerariifolium]